jgi:hypothetical protein
MSEVTVARKYLIHSPRAEEEPDNEGWIMKRRKNDRKENNTNTKPSKASEKKGAVVVVDLTEKAENNNNSNKAPIEEVKNNAEKIKFTQILRDRINGKFSDEDLRLLLVKVLSKPGQSKYHISNDELHIPISTLPAESCNNNAREPEAHTAQGSTDSDQMREESSSSSSDDDYASDHSNNGDWGLLDDSSPFALTQSFFQDTQQSFRDIISSQVKREPVSVESKPLPKMELNLPLDEDLIEVVESSDEEKMQIDTRPRAASCEQTEQKSPGVDTSPGKRSNESLFSGSVDDWVTRKKPKTLSDYFSAGSRSGSASSLQGLDASAELKKGLASDQSSDAVLVSMTSSLISSSSFSSRDKMYTEPIQFDDDDFKSPSSRGISPIKMKSQAYEDSTKSKSTPKKSSKPTSDNSKKFKKQDKSSNRPTRRLDPDDDGNDLDDFK